MDPGRLDALSARNTTTGLSPEEWNELKVAWESTTAAPGIPGLATSDMIGIARALREASDRTHILEAAKQWAASSGGCACSGEEPPDPAPDLIEEVEATLRRRAAAPALWWLTRRFDSAGNRSAAS